MHGGWILDQLPIESKVLLTVLSMFNAECVSEELFLGETKSEYAKFADRHRYTLHVSPLRCAVFADFCSLASAFSQISRHYLATYVTEKGGFCVEKIVRYLLLETLCLRDDQKTNAFTFAIEATLYQISRGALMKNFGYLICLTEVYCRNNIQWTPEHGICRDLCDSLSILVDYGLSSSAQTMSKILDDIHWQNLDTLKLDKLTGLKIQHTNVRILHTTGVSGRLVALRKRERILEAIPYQKNNIDTYRKYAALTCLDLVDGYAEFKSLDSAEDLLHVSSQILGSPVEGIDDSPLIALWYSRRAYLASINANSEDAHQFIQSAIALVRQHSALAHVYKLQLAGILIQFSQTEKAEAVLHDVMNSPHYDGCMDDFASEAMVFLGVIFMYHKRYRQAM